MTPVLEEALKSLTNRINLSTGLAHPLDSDSAKEMFKLLRDKAVTLTKSDVSEWAINNGWSSRHASDLGELAEKIGNGGRVQIRNKGRWKEDVFDLWKERVKES